MDLNKKILLTFLKKGYIFNILSIIIYSVRNGAFFIVKTTAGIVSLLRATLVISLIEWEIEAVALLI